MLFLFFAVVKETLLPHVAVRKQVSVLTDQVEAQGVKISDLQSSLEEHQHKLDSTEEMLQQVQTSTAGTASVHIGQEFRNDARPRV